jgi:hypothetical protein
MPKKRTPTIATWSSAIDGCRAAAAMRNAAVPISPMPLATVATPRAVAAAT